MQAIEIIKEIDDSRFLGEAQGAGQGNSPEGALFVRTLLSRALRYGYGSLQLLSAPHEAARLKAALPGSALHAHIVEHSGMTTLAAQPFVCARWPSGERLARMIEHFAIVDGLGHPFNIGTDQFVEIIAFDIGSQRCRLMLDRPSWFDCDGLLTMSLWVETHRSFSISFCLSESEDGRVAYVGGIQGRKDIEALEENRVLTKAAFGMRPRDFTLELFKMLLPKMGVTHLKCVSDANRYHMTKRAMLTIGTRDRVLLKYDEVWCDRGGRLGADGFFELAIERRDRETGDIPARKRSMYAARYALLDRLNAAINEAFNAALPAFVHH